MEFSKEEPDTCLHIEAEGIEIKNYLLTLGHYSLGSEACDILIYYPTISKKHAEIKVSKEGVYFCDKSSLNGSWLIKKSGQKELLKPQISTLWLTQDRILIGSFTLWHEKMKEKTDLFRKKELLVHYAQTYQKFLNETPKYAQEILGKKLESHPEIKEEILENIHHEFHGDGPIRNFLNHPSCREILINAYDQIYVDIGEGLMLAQESFLSKNSFEAWALRIVHLVGRRLDLQHPICEATLPNGARFHAVLSPISAKNLCVAIRKFGSAPIDEKKALESNWMDKNALEILQQAVVQKLNIIISGGTSSGKTSLLNFLCHYLDPKERVITVEDTVELNLSVKNLVQLQARGANADGVGQITLRELVQCALRMRPDRIIVGECRGAEVLEMLQALNTGHPGSLTTIHANSAIEALHRLELLALLGAHNLSMESIREWIRSSVHLIVQLERNATGHRHVLEIAKMKEGRLQVEYQRCN